MSSIPVEDQDKLLGRAAEIGRVVAKYGLRERSSGDVPMRERARNLKNALEELGPTFAKLGQILSTRPDLLPPEFIDELATLQDKVTPMNEEDVVSVMEEELGVPWEDVFESIEPEPLAAGTIGQVHVATLESGQKVVIKVQRRGARVAIMRDLGLLELFASKAENRPGLRKLVDIPAVIRHLSDSLYRELDFRQEAANIGRLREVLRPYSRLKVPDVVPQISTSRLLVLDFIDGVNVREAPPVPERRAAARQLIESYYRQILVDGFFHADPHPGNLLWSDGDVYFLDCGMVGELDAKLREQMMLLVTAFWQGDDAFVAEIVLSLSGGDSWPDIDLTQFEFEISHLFSGVRGQSLREIELGPLMQSITQIAARHDLRLPAALALTGKALAQMQLAATTLDPELDPLSVVGPFVLKMLAERVRHAADPTRAFYEGQKAMLRVRRFIQAAERMAGARPGRRLEIDLPAISSMEGTIRRSVRRLCLAAGASASIIATGFAASTKTAPDWLGTSFGIAAAVLSGLLIADFIWPRGRDR
ncbi:MAG TPA: AarF/UbiB family protein [Gaiellaceae bacterium]|nr:AarF/UbiB family protein [Gaiellaceae bacterium]